MFTITIKHTDIWFLVPKWGQDETAIRAGGDLPVGDAVQSGMAASFIGRRAQIWVAHMAAPAINSIAGRLVKT